MTLHELHEPPAPALARALAEFESRFTYPLGPTRHFRISHGADYSRFFRAIGDGRCFVAQDAGRVIGVVGVAICPLTCPNGSVRMAAYIGDLKVDPSVRHTRAFIRLAKAADAWARPQATAAFGVVMDGTRATPASYSGRAGLELFTESGKVFVLQFSTSDAHVDHEAQSWICDAARGSQCYRTLSAARYATCGGIPAERSETAPLWLVDPAGVACGRLEDTRRAKRLIDSDNIEMQSAHLACFAFGNPDSAAKLIQIALRHASARGFPALFVCVSEHDMSALESTLAGVDKLIAPATIYGAGLQNGFPWNINSSEI